MIIVDSHDREILLNLNFLEQLLSCIKIIRLFPEKKSPDESCWCVIGYILLDKITSMYLYREAALSRVYTSVLFFKKTLCGFQGS
jgi:hypothetical protein